MCNWRFFQKSQQVKEVSFQSRTHVVLHTFPRTARLLCIFYTTIILWRGYGPRQL